VREDLANFFSAAAVVQRTGEVDAQFMRAVQRAQHRNRHQAALAPVQPGARPQRCIVWCAVSTYVLIAIVKKELQLDASLYTCLQILSVSVFEKSELSCALQADAYQTDLPDIANQLNLFDF